MDVKESLKFRQNHFILETLERLPGTLLTREIDSNPTRFLTTAVHLVEGGVVTVTGSHRLTERPMSDLINALVENKCSFKFLGNPGCVPFEGRKNPTIFNSLTN